ncbi:hypothetical protein [Nonomuraea sp. NPDC049646]|uniref:hypothetical protein n=1 Tax=unclassified Nonomuraea TaxID=2593643 RepID=UPI0037927FFA
MAKRKGGNHNRRLNDRLWDDTGQEWTRVVGRTYGTSAQRAAELFADRSVRMGSWRMSGPVTWADSPAERERQRHRYSHSGSEPGVAIEVTEWARPSGERLLLVEEHC